MLDPLDPETTMAFKLLYSVKDFLADPPVLSRASFRIRFTWDKRYIEEAAGSTTYRT